jgi:chromosome partitioning protein
MEFGPETRARVGQSLKFSAQSRDISQKELSEALELSSSTISKIWSGALKKPTHYKAMASWLGFELAELIRGEEGGEADANTKLEHPEEGASEQDATNIIELESLTFAQNTSPARTCQIITIAARKGGATKTTTSVHLSGALATAGYKVLLVDLDGQCDSTEWLLPIEAQIQTTADDVLRNGADPREGLMESIIDGLDILPAAPQLDTVEAAMAGQWGMERRLADLISPLRQMYDFILFDCPAAMDFRIVSALMTSDWVIIPTTASTLDLKGLISFIPRVLHYADPARFNSNLQFLGILISRVKRNTLIAREAREWLGDEFDGLVFDNVIHESTRYQELAGFQSLIYDHDPEWAADYEGVAREILERVGFIDANEEDALLAANGGQP